MSVTRIVTITLLAVVAALSGLIEFRARRGRSKLPTLADICGFVMRYQAGRMPVGRIAVYGFWWWLGWHFFAR
jgi:hypothetical protein